MHIQVTAQLAEPARLAHFLACAATPPAACSVPVRRSERVSLAAIHPRGVPLHDPASPARHVRFGAFELDLRSNELRKGPTRLKVPDQSIEILKALLEQPGELVTREELRERLWPADTFVDFEHGLNAAVRRLREALGDSADAPRFVETLPRRGYRFVSAVEGRSPLPPPSPAATQPLATTTQEQSTRGWRPKRLALTAALVGSLLLAAAIAVTRPWARSSSLIAPAAAPVATRLTSDPGLQGDPAISPDGRSVAYTANTSGNFDIWMQPVAGGDAVPVTKDPAHDWQPDWSPDGNLLVFRSERRGGGLFVTPFTGGTAQQLTKFGYLPRWSPDGTRVLFEETVLIGAGRARLYTVGLDGREPQVVSTTALSANQRGAAATGWHPDARSVVFLSATPSPVPVEIAAVDLATGETRRGVVDAAVLNGFRDLSLWTVSVEPLAWDPESPAVYFVGRSKGLFSVWTLDVEPSTLHITGGPRRLTTMTEESSHITLSGNGRRLAFGAAARTPRIALYALDSSGRTIVRNSRLLSPPELHARAPDLTSDGSKVVFGVQRRGSGRGTTEFWEQATSTGSHRTLVISDFYTRGEQRSFLRWSPDGRWISYRFIRPSGGGQRGRIKSLVLLDVRTLTESQLTTPSPVLERGDEAAYGWSPDAKYIVSSSGTAISLIPVSAAPDGQGKAIVVVKNDEYSFWNTGLSPNGRWICFSLMKTRATSELGVVSRSGGDLIALSDEMEWVDKPRWSIDGKLIYFVSRRGGMFNIWAVEFEPVAGTFVGHPFQVTHFSGPGEQIPADMAIVELGVARGSLAVPIINPTGGVWMLENLKR